MEEAGDEREYRSQHLGDETVDRKEAAWWKFWLLRPVILKILVLYDTTLCSFQIGGPTSFQKNFLFRIQC